MAGKREEEKEESYLNMETEERIAAIKAQDPTGVNAAMLSLLENYQGTI